MLINYDELTKQYQEDIKVKLRGFRPAHDFLEMWVHDEDDVKSIVNIAESAELNGVKSIEIQVGKNTWTAIDPDRLKDMLGAGAQASISENEAGAIIKVEYA